jgi:hypothetical protein
VIYLAFVFGHLNRSLVFNHRPSKSKTSRLQDF